MSVCRDKGLSWELREDCGRFSLRDTRNDTTLIYPISAASVLRTVKAYFVQKSFIEPEPEKPVSDDFDPFLDSDELP